MYGTAIFICFRGNNLCNEVNKRSHILHNEWHNVEVNIMSTFVNGWISDPIMIFFTDSGGKMLTYVQYQNFNTQKTTGIL